ncbi:hypothetical protein JCM3774_004260 [Rhodotorula dairenensis]
MGSLARCRQLTLHPYFLASARSGEEGRDLLLDASPAPPKAALLAEPEVGPAVDRLSALPQEILWLICEQMAPGSLVQASRVSKLFRRMLTTKKAEKLWRQARLNEGWKDLEAGGWNEIQYAKFIDGTECQVCGKVASSRLQVKRRMVLRAYAFLNEESWWCWCSVTDDDTIIEVFEEEMIEIFDFDPAAGTDEEYDDMLDCMRSLHASCLRFPEAFTSYWDVCGDGCEGDWGETDEPDAEWCDLADLYVHLSQTNKEQRKLREDSVARPVRREALRPLFERIKQLSALRQNAHFFTFAYFCEGLDSIKRLWSSAGAAPKPVHLPRVERFLVKEVCDEIRWEKVRLFLRIAHAILDDGPTSVLPHWAVSMLDYVDSRIRDLEQRDTLKRYCLSGVVDVDMDAILSRATALFRCGFCSTKLLYPAIANHLVETHRAGPVTAYAHVPAPAFRRAVNDLLVEMNLPRTTSCETLAGHRFDVEETSASGVQMTLCDQSWDEVLAGKADCELPRKRRQVDGDKTDRAIVAIRLHATATVHESVACAKGRGWGRTGSCEVVETGARAVVEGGDERSR